MRSIHLIKSNSFDNSKNKILHLPNRLNINKICTRVKFAKNIEDSNKTKELNGDISSHTKEKRHLANGNIQSYNCDGKSQCNGTNPGHDPPAVNNNAKQSKLHTDSVSTSANSPGCDTLHEKASPTPFRLSALERFTPMIVLGSGEVFGRCSQLESWLQLGECSEVRRMLMTQYTSLPPPANKSTAKGTGPLAALLRHTTA